MGFGILKPSWITSPAKTNYCILITFNVIHLLYLKITLFFVYQGERERLLQHESIKKMQQKKKASKNFMKNKTTRNQIRNESPSKKKKKERKN